MFTQCHLCAFRRLQLFTLSADAATTIQASIDTFVATGLGRY